MNMDRDLLLRIFRLILLVARAKETEKKIKNIEIADIPDRLNGFIFKQRSKFRVRGGIFRGGVFGHITAHVHGCVPHFCQANRGRTMKKTNRENINVLNIVQFDSTKTYTTMLPKIPHGSTVGVTLEDTSSASTTLVITTHLLKDQTSMADRGETKQWLLPVTIVATVVGPVIVVIVIAFLISLAPPRASRQERPFVNRGLQWGNQAEQVERNEMNANRGDSIHDTVVYANVPEEETIAPNTHSHHTAALVHGPDTDCNSLGPDGTRLYSEAGSVDCRKETTSPGEQKEQTYVELDFSENQQTPGSNNGRYQPVEYVMVDFTQTNTLKSE